ncbi:uncharacterized protein RHIMIDRAFT_9687 [Rhizopus microsporus ATCC 52813]|uniref:Transposase n=1 Tax=Rhizopus microsporus ATCC 52813 TaxID=1340429 RepID=A0A2G4T9B9_RHIZD|nr:uncharacterized protein RHIMIDRAFT_9687 [Rhizopus microsporus ATCC 52813]PHZ17602.1 hypothetical protein RHIMIDRAFT_9687 [Rhizopus microsporus ATCC 52813]
MYRIFCFMKGYNHRETKGYLYSNRQITDDYMCQLMLVKTSPGALCTLAHRTSTKTRQKARRSFKKSNQTNQVDDGRRTVIAYDNRTQRALAKKAIVISVDEVRTSITCCKCHRKLDQKHETQTLVYNHRKKQLRLGGKKNAAQQCLDDDHHVICQTLQCSERRPSSFLPAIYQLKQCRLCSVGNGQDTVWQRDVNAAINICLILISYIESGYKILSRHLSLTRGGTFDSEGATAQPL